MRRRCARGGGLPVRRGRHRRRAPHRRCARGGHLAGPYVVGAKGLEPL